MKDLMILCDVIDNYGDIGFVYRLCRRISEVDPSLNLRIVVNNLKTFSSIAEGLDAEKNFQIYCSWKIFNWNDRELCSKEFSENPPEKILQCFQCVRPGWFEDIIFSPDFKNEIQIVNVEYLTAEEWADDFHLLKGATRSSNVKKINFMPGFTEKTGGLILDNDFMNSLNKKRDEHESLRILLFSYPKNFLFLVKALNRFSKTKKVELFVANGVGKKSFIELSHLLNENCAVYELPYLPQIKWDDFLCSVDFALIRGEDSFSRAVLTGKPFVWNIYEQDEQYHLVKLEAFLRRLKPSKELERFSFLYNRNLETELCGEAATALCGIENFPQTEEKLQEELENLLVKILEDLENQKEPFEKFAKQTLALGDMAEKLLKILY